MEKQNWVLAVTVAMISFWGGSTSRAEMENQVSVDQATCCEPCHVTTNCKSPESPDRVSTVQNSKPSSAGNAAEASQ